MLKKYDFIHLIYSFILINCDIFICEGSTFTKFGQQAHGV